MKVKIGIILNIMAGAFGASAYNVNGVVADVSGQGEPFATYRIYAANDSVKPVSIGVTDVDGRFVQSLDSAGRYRITVQAVNKKPIDVTFGMSEADLSLDTLFISDASRVLGEVKVVAQRPLVTREIDRIGYDVQADDDSKSSTIMEMLRKVPLVSVDGEDKITVRGSSNFKIYKNGRPNNTFSNNPKEVLGSIPASMIKRIEVITEPGAKYDAEGVGAIINIVTLDNTIIKGIMGSASLSTNSTNIIPQPNLWLMSQIDKVTFSLNAGYNNISDEQTRSQSESQYFYKDSGSTLNSTSAGTNPGNLMYISTEASYELDSLNLFSAEFGGYYYNVKPIGSGSAMMSNADGNIIYSLTQNYNFKRYSYLDFNGSLNYQHSTRRKGETITLSYMLSTTDQTRDQFIEYTDMVNAPIDYTQSNAYFDLNFIEHTFQADWVRPFAKIHQIDLGAKYILRDNNSITDQEFVGSHASHSDFAHITDIAAAYADYRINLGKWSARAGLRYEYSHLKAEYRDGSNPDFGSNLSDWVPSASVAWRPDGANSLSLNYASRINRPGISYLNPAVEESVTTTSQGNPTLESARHNSLKLSYMYISPKLNMNLSAGYEFSDNVIANYTYVKDDHIYSTYGNIGSGRILSLGGYLQWAITRKTSFLLNANAAYNQYANESVSAQLSRWTATSYAQLTQRLPWKLTLGLTGYWYSGFISDAYSYSTPIKGSVYYNISLQRSFLKEDRLTVKLAAGNIFGPDESEAKTITVNGDYVGDTRAWQFNRQSVGLNISYRFGSLNAQVKKTAKTIANDDLIGRKK